MLRFCETGVLLACLILVHCGDAQAKYRTTRHTSSNGEFSFQLESNGAILPSYEHRGKSYVEGTWGSDYQIRVFNHTPRRVEAVITVDGRDVITGQTGNYRKSRGYVIAAHSSVLIDGFRTSWQRVAAFRFTDTADSYAARMGSSRNVGVIGVAIFRENSPPPPQPIIQYRARKSRGGYDAAESSADSAPAPELRSKGRSGRYQEQERQSLGTQYGDDTYSPSTSTRFERRSRTRPDTLLSIYYDDYEGLRARGVFPRQRPRYDEPEPEPFPGNFTPPPPRYYWE